MGCGTGFVKYVLFFFNLLVALLGLAVVGIGVATLLNYTPITDAVQKHANLAVAPWVFIIIGAIMFIIAFFGCCGAIRESHCMVVTYAIFLLVIIIVQVIMAVLMFTYAQSIEDALVRGVNTLFDQRSSQDDAQRAAADNLFNNLQQQLQCCGKKGPGDYLALSLPASCCGQNVLTPYTNTCVVVSAYPGCSQRVAEFFRKYNKIIPGVAIGVACVEVVGALFALCLANSIRNMDRRSRY